MSPLRNTACSCGELSLEMPSFSSRTSVTKTCCNGMLGRGKFEVLAQAHKHISESLLQFANVARAAYLKHDALWLPFA